MAVSLAVSTNVTANQSTTQPDNQKDTAQRPRLCIAQQKNMAKGPFIATQLNSTIFTRVYPLLQLGVVAYKT